LNENSELATSRDLHEMDQMVQLQTLKVGDGDDDDGDDGYCCCYCCCWEE
jgi:hypothetical protein